MDFVLNKWMKIFLACVNMMCVWGLGGGDFRQPFLAAYKKADHIKF